MHHLVRNIYIFALIMLIVYAGGWYYHYRETNRQVEENTRSAAEISLRLLENRIEGYLSARSGKIEAVAVFYATRRFSAEDSQAYLESILAADSDFEAVYFATPDGRLLAAGYQDLPAGGNSTDLPWVRKTIDSGHPVVTASFTGNGNHSQVPTLTLACPAYNSGGELVGVAGGSIAGSSLNTLVGEEIRGLLPEAESYLLVAHGEKELSALPAYLLSTGNAGIKTAADLEMPAEGVSKVTIAEQEGYIATTPLEGTDFHLASFIPFESLTTGTGRLSGSFLVTLGTSLLVVMVFMVYHRLYLQRPLFRLENQLKKINIEKNPSFRLPPEENSEFAMISETINNLLDKTQNYFTRLEENKRELTKTNLELEEMLEKLANAEEALDYSEEKLYFLSYYDQLTGLYNRFYFEAKLKQLADKQIYPLTIISADIDRLKVVNENFGYEAGDRILKTCAGFLNETLGSEGILARVGGDEFSAILPLTGEQEAQCLARQVRNLVDHHNLHNPNLFIGLSLGVATATQKTATIRQLIKEADDLVLAKKQA